MIALLAAATVNVSCDQADGSGRFGVRNETGDAVIVRIVGRDGEQADFLAPARSTVHLVATPPSVVALTLLLEYECLEAGGMDLDDGQFELGGTIVLDERRDVTFEEGPPSADAPAAPRTVQCHEGSSDDPVGQAGLRSLLGVAQRATTTTPWHALGT